MSKQATRKIARMCTTHIGGRFGRLLMEQFVSKGWITKEKPDDKFYIITPAGEEEFEKLGIDLSQLKSE